MFNFTIMIIFSLEKGKFWGTKGEKLAVQIRIITNIYEQ